ncbi:MAG: potassium-transporting ATPase subunit C [Polyangiales bacterium]
MIREMLTGLRFILGTLLICAVIYPAVLLGVGSAVVSERAQGSLVKDDHGVFIGSRLIAQRFTRREYLWPRPSAVDYNAAAAGGSNLAASNPALTRRAQTTATLLRATTAKPVPGELIAASGSGLDPHITLRGALYQSRRIAQAREVSQARVDEVLRQQASGGTPWSPELVNVLETNIALDENLGTAPPR